MLELKFRFEKYELVGREAVDTRTWIPTFRRNLFLPHSGWIVLPWNLRKLFFSGRNCYLYTQLHSVTFQKTVILLRFWSGSVFVEAMFCREWCIYVHSKRIWKSLNCPNPTDSALFEASFIEGHIFSGAFLGHRIIPLISRQYNGIFFDNVDLVMTLKWKGEMWLITGFMSKEMNWTESISFEYLSTWFVFISPLYVMRFIIPVVFYEVTNVRTVCVYSSNTTVFIGGI